jgi:hypothetical protein
LLDDYNNKNYVVAGAEWKFPDNLILDLQLIVTDFSLYENAQHNIVYLKNISFDGNELTLAFGGNNSGQEITSFTLSEIEGNFPVYLRNEEGSLIVLGEGIVNFMEACNGTSVSLDTFIAVEPGVCVEYRNDWEGVAEILVSPEKESNEDNTAIPLLPLEPVSTPTRLTGDVVFLEGYNFNVAVRDYFIDLLVGVGHGLAMDCSTNFIAPEFMDCASIVSYINGIPPDENGNFRILEGANVVISPGSSIADFSDNFTELSNDNTLFVGLSFQKTDLCSPITPSIL